MSSAKTMEKIQKICFLAYEPRSGSTILSKYLTENYNVFVVPECNFIIDILKRYYISHSLEETDKQDLLDLIASDRKLSDWGISENLSCTTSKSSNFFTSLGYVYLAQNLQFILINLYKKVRKLPRGENILFLEPER